MVPSPSLLLEFCVQLAVECRGRASAAQSDSSKMASIGTLYSCEPTCPAEDVVACLGSMERE